MATITDIRTKYPQYSDLTDRELAEKLHTKFYSDMPFEEFASKVQLKEPSYAETAVGAVTDLPTTVSNIPGSAAQLVGGIYEAVTNPIETVTTMAVIGAGGIRNAAIMAERNGALPQGSVDFLDSLSDPAAAAAASEKAAAFGGVIADRWGSAEKIRRTLREDPVGFLGDLATIATGVGGAARTAGLAGVGGKAGAVATAIDPLTLAGKGASAVGRQVNRMVPSQAGAAAQAGANMLPRVVQQIETTGRRILAGPKARALADITEGRDVNALISALEKPSVFPRTAAEAAAPTGMSEYVALQQRLAERGGTEAAAQAAKTKRAIEAPLANIRGTPAQREAAVKQRSAMADPFYKAADSSFIKEDATLRELLGRPEIAAAAREASEKARSERRAAVQGETRASTTKQVEAGVTEDFRPIYKDVTTPATTASYSGKFLSDIIEELKADYDTRRTMPTADARSNRILKKTIDDLEAWYQQRSPERKAAKELFEMYSRPINRKDVGKLFFDAMSPTTMRGTSDMNFDAFAKLLEDEPATVAKALNWASTTKKFKDTLNQNDINAIKAIDAERLNKNLAQDLETFGRERAAGVVSDIYSTGDTPNMLNRFVTLFNMVKRLVGAKLSDKSIAEMAIEALDPKLAAKALKEMQTKLKAAPVRQMPGMPAAPAPVKGAAKVARAVAAGARELPRPSKPGLTAAGTVANTLAQARENYPNAFLTDAYGRSYDAQGNRLR
jgi:hypothetical protein